MPLRDHFNQLKAKAEELNKKHNLLPLGQNNPQQQQPSYGGQQSYYPGQQQPQYQPPQQQQQWQQPPQQQWQQPQQQQWQQPPQPNEYNRPPPPAPPVPLHSRPSQYGAAAAPQQEQQQVYWRMNPQPGVPVSQDFEQKQGHGEPHGWGNNELENYTANAENSFYTPNGPQQQQLTLRAISRPQHPDPEARYTSARLVSRQTLARRRGCLTAWLTLPMAPGIWPAFWLLPREPFAWPYEGEVDIAESWNAEAVNHSCLHWGFYTPADASKHLVRHTPIPDLGRRAVRYDFVWDCEQTGAGLRGDGKSAGGGRLMWSIDGRPVMKNLMPEGTRPIEDWCILLNVAMGGNVCQGKAPAEGSYDMVVHGLQMTVEPEGGWARFESEWHSCPDGAVM